MEKKEYKPGETGVIEAVLQTRHYYGKIKKNILVTTDSSSTPKFFLNLSMEIYAELKPVTTNIEFKNIISGKEIEKKVLIEKNMTEDLKINGFSFDKNILKTNEFDLSVNAEKNITGETYINFKLKKKNKVQLKKQLKIPVFVKTNSKSVNIIRFDLFISEQKSFEVSPKALYMYSSKIGKEKIKKIKIKCNENSEFKIKKVYSEDKNLSFLIEELGSNEKLVWIGVNKNAKKGKIASKINIDLLINKKIEKIQIPVRGTVSK